MPNEYSVEIHRYLNQKISETESALKEETDYTHLYQGQLDELYWIRNYLGENIDLKNFIYF